MSHKKFNEEQSDYEKNGVSSDEFPIDKKFLGDLFIRHEIESGESLEKIRNNGLIPGLSDKLRTHPKNGLNSNDKDDLEKRGRFYGLNIPPPRELKSLWELVTTLCILKNLNSYSRLKNHLEIQCSELFVLLG